MGVEPNLAPMLPHHLDYIDEDDRDIEEMFEICGGPNEVFPYVTSLKEEGNSLFKLKDYGNAFVKYNKAIKCLCVAITAVCEDIHECGRSSLFKDLAIPLQLNIAACAIKLGKFNKVIVLCSLIMKFDNNNVKALFRRGLALMKSGIFEKAYNDMKRAIELEPKNSEIQKELANLEDIIVVQLRPKVEDEVNQGSEVGISAGKEFADIQEESMDSRKFGEMDQEEQSVINHEKEGDEKTLEKESTTRKVGKLRNEKPCDPPRNMNSVWKTTFVNRKRSNSFLRISMMDVEKLEQEKELQVYHPKSMSFSKVRTFIPKSTILMESPHNCILREAEGSILATAMSNDAEEVHLGSTTLSMEEDKEDQSSSSLLVEKRQEEIECAFDQDKTEAMQTQEMRSRDHPSARTKGDCSRFSDDNDVLDKKNEEHHTKS